MRTVAAAIVLSLLAACGGPDAGAARVPRVDRKQAEALLVQRAKERYPAFHVDGATCPTDVEARVGESFTCTVDVEGQAARYTLTISEMLGSQARYDIRPIDVIVDVAGVAAFVRSRLEDDWRAATVDCGRSKVKVAAVGAAIECTAFNGSTTRYIQAVVDDVDGSISLRER